MHMKTTKIPAHPSQNDCHQHIWQMLQRLWRERNPYSLLAGVQTDIAIMEISLKISQKIKNRNTIWLSCFTPRHLPTKLHTPPYEIFASLCLSLLYPLQKETEINLVVHQQMDNENLTYCTYVCMYTQTHTHNLALKKKCDHITCRKMDRLDM